MKSAREKLIHLQEWRKAPIPTYWESRFGKGTMLIPTPLMVDELIREIPYAQVTTLSAIRRELGRRYGCETACPLATGVGWRIAAQVAEEDAREHLDEITPYWRIVRDDGRLNPKLPGGHAHQAKLLVSEGHSIVRSGKRDLRLMRDEVISDPWRP